MPTSPKAVSSHMMSMMFGAMRACLARLEPPVWPELSPSQLCEAGCVGERTLQCAFRERFGLTPAAFLKSCRLAAVRNALRRAAPEASVADIAAAFGFWHTGQFAVDYKRAFGGTPFRDTENGATSVTESARR
jgi:transcriptional regulator GlxA family with amidase domain